MIECLYENTKTGKRKKTKILQKNFFKNIFSRFLLVDLKDELLAVIWVSECVFDRPSAGEQRADVGGAA